MRRLLASLLTCLPLLVAAGPVATISYHGTIIDARTGRGPLATTPLDLTFRLYPSPSGGGALWGRTVPVKVEESGDFYVELTDNAGDAADGASCKTLQRALAMSPVAVWLSIAAPDGTETERVKIASAPRACHALGTASADVVKTTSLKAGKIVSSHSTGLDTLSTGTISVEDVHTTVETPSHTNDTFSASRKFQLTGAVHGIQHRGGNVSGRAASDSLQIRKMHIPSIGDCYSTLVFPAGTEFGGEGETITTISFGKVK